MSYFKGESRKKKYKVDLLITGKESWLKTGVKPSPLEEGNIVHFLFSQIIEDKGEIQTLESVVISLDLAKDAFWGPYYIGIHNAQVDYDVSDVVHIRGYCHGILGLKGYGDPKEERIFDDKERTAFIPKLSYGAWEIVAELLNKVRAVRIRNRIAHPRKSRNVKFTDDILDTSVSKIISRVNAILNEILFWGRQEERFSPDTEVFLTLKNC